MKIGRLIVLLLTMIGSLSSCTTFKQPGVAEPHATLNFQRSGGEGGSFLMQGRILSYFVSLNESCSEAPRVAAFATGDLSSDVKSVRLAPDAPTKILAWLRINNADFRGGVYQRTGQFDCAAEAQFSPMEGETYEVSFSVNESAVCKFEVVGKDGFAPSDFVSSDDVCSERPKMIPN